MMNIIESPQNGRLKYLAKLLTQAKARRQHRQAVMEGIHLVQAYLAHGCQPKQVYIPQHLASNAEIAALITQLPSDGITWVADQAVAKISSLTEGETVTALIDLPNPTPPPKAGDCIVLEAIQDPGNVGTILRSAAAAGVRQVILSPECADVWSPKVLRSAMGAHFSLEIADRVDLNEWRQSYQDKIQITALIEGRTENLYHLNLLEPSAWVFGNEGSGVSDEVLAWEGQLVKIPMQQQTESLNVAMAATVCLFEQQRQRYCAEISP